MIVCVHAFQVCDRGVMAEMRGVEYEGEGLEEIWLWSRDEILYLATKGVEVVGGHGSVQVRLIRLQHLAWGLINGISGTGRGLLAKVEAF